MTAIADQIDVTTDVHNGFSLTVLTDRETGKSVRITRCSPNDAPFYDWGGCGVTHGRDVEPLIRLLTAAKEIAEA